MSFFKRFFSKEKVIEEEVAVAKAPTVFTPSDPYTLAGLTKPVSETEYETVALIASSILAGNQPDSTFVVKSIQAIDEEKQVVAAIAASILAGDQPDSTFKLVHITEA